MLPVPWSYALGCAKLQYHQHPSLCGWHTLPSHGRARPSASNVLLGKSITSDAFHERLAAPSWRSYQSCQIAFSKKVPFLGSVFETNDHRCYDASLRERPPSIVGSV
uniref:Uncharacterized protein n=1 Tax=Anopheles albimanus TaxID=7167 RepID=A0A182FSA8_ANOAL